VGVNHVIIFMSNRMNITEHRGRAVNTPTSYSGVLGFKSRPHRPGVLTEVLCGFPQFLQVNARIVP
jgi:hypothetical protein